MIHKLSFALSIGLLQKYEKTQVVVACFINVTLFVYLLVAQPFNERGRWMVEVLAQGAFTLAVTLVMLFVLDVELNMDVGFVVNTLMMGGMVCKMLFQFSKTIRAVVKKLTAVCTPSNRGSLDIAEAESVQEMVLHDAGFDAFHLSKVGLEDSTLHNLPRDESNKSGSVEKVSQDVGLGVFCRCEVGLEDSSLHEVSRDECFVESPVDFLDVELREVFFERTASVCDHQL